MFIVHLDTALPLADASPPSSGGFRVWVGIGDSGMTAQQYADRLMREAKVWVNPGTMYGPQSGEGFIRLNIACPQHLLLEALQRIAGL